jgi:hypothetical protein
VDTETGLRLERLRYHSTSELQAARFDPEISEEEKRRRVEAIRREHTIRAQRLIEEAKQTT